jgi:hypothetical protein
MKLGTSLQPPCGRSGTKNKNAIGRKAANGGGTGRFPTLA